VYFRRLDTEAHLGYRKGKQGSAWFARWRKRGADGRWICRDLTEQEAEEYIKREA